MKYLILTVSLLFCMLQQVKSATLRMIKNVHLIVVYKYDLMNPDKKIYLCHADYCYLNNEIYPLANNNSFELLYGENSPGALTEGCKPFARFYDREIKDKKEPRIQVTKYLADSIVSDNSEFFMHYGGQMFIDSGIAIDNRSSFYIACEINADVVITNDSKGDCVLSTSLSDSYDIAKKQGEQLVILKVHQAKVLSGNEMKKLNIKRIESFSFSYMYTDH